MTRVSRDTPAGEAYLDLQNRARREGRATQELLTLYVVERWLARLNASPYAEQFVLKGGMLLAAFDARRPTVDADALARHLDNDLDTVIGRVVEIASISADDGVDFRTNTVTARRIREEALYAGVRIAMDASIATATVKFRLDVNFGDPVTPAPVMIDLPSLRPDAAPVRVLGYPLQTILAEKIVTAITLGDGNTRVRDYVDIYVLTGHWDIEHTAARDALLATAEHRGARLGRLSAAIERLNELRQQTYIAYRSSLGIDGDHLPEAFTEVIQAVSAFADPLVEPAEPHCVWVARRRCWTNEPSAWHHGRSAATATG